MITDDNAELLTVLQAHGQDFMNSFALPSLPAQTSKKRKRGQCPLKVQETETTEDSLHSRSKEEEEEEWFGFNSTGQRLDEEPGQSISRRGETVCRVPYSPSLTASL